VNLDLRPAPEVWWSVGITRKANAEDRMQRDFWNYARHYTIWRRLEILFRVGRVLFCRYQMVAASLDSAMKFYLRQGSKSDISYPRSNWPWSGRKIPVHAQRQLRNFGQGRPHRANIILARAVCTCLDIFLDHRREGARRKGERALARPKRKLTRRYLLSVSRNTSQRQTHT
jgi:hypothetical protein